jgi:hypothetical protein
MGAILFTGSSQSQTPVKNNLKIKKDCGKQSFFILG